MKKTLNWPLSIGIFYGSFVLALLCFLIFSLLNKEDLESSDYYAKELAYQKQIDRLKNSEKYGYTVSWKIDPKNKYIVIQFPNSLDFSEINGRITLFRPSNSKLDRIIPIRVDQDGKQIIKTNDFNAGNWRLKILWQNSDGEFFQDGKITIPKQGA